MQRGRHCRSGPYSLQLPTSIIGQLETMLSGLVSLFVVYFHLRQQSRYWGPRSCSCSLHDLEGAMSCDTLE